jgi:uncharacterized protein (DUF2252 family)
VAEHWSQLLREPDEVAGKWAKMRATQFGWLRGTAQIFALDESRLAMSHAPTHRDNANLPLVWLVADPHPENIAAVFGPDGQWSLEFDDLDAATWGPFTFDLRRLALGVWLLAEDAAVEDSQRDSWARAAAAAYAAEINALAAGYAPSELATPATVGVVFGDLLARARQAREEGRSWATFAKATPAGHKLVRGELDAPGEGFLTSRLDEPTPEQRALVVADLVAQFQVRVLDVARRRGQGVSSYANWRFYAVVDRGEEGPQDDTLLEWKECGEPIRFEGLPRALVPPAMVNGQRIVAAMRNLQSRPDLDPWLAWTQHGALSAKIRSRSDAVGDREAGLSSERLADKLAKGKWKPDDLVVLASVAGRLLAQAHARGPTLGGRSGLAVLAPEVAAAGVALVEETVAVAHATGVQQRTDRALTIAMANQYGPLLGWRPVPSQTLGVAP